MTLNRSRLGTDALIHPLEFGAVTLLLRYKLQEGWNRETLQTIQHPYLFVCTSIIDSSPVQACKYLQLYSLLFMILLNSFDGFCTQNPSPGVRSTLLFKDGITQPAAAISALVVIESVLVECTSKGVRSPQKIIQLRVLGGLENLLSDTCVYVFVGSREQDEISAGLPSMVKLSSMRRMWVCKGSFQKSCFILIVWS